MKWYMALNEAGTSGDIALHTKLAVLSAARHTDLIPHLLYSGNRNAFTAWLERQGVTIIDSTLPYMDLITGLTAAGKYNLSKVGHWLRTNVCLEERQERHVFYTDVDVLFLDRPGLAGLTPRYFSAAPEFDKTSTNYFNAGVMMVNTEGLREEYGLFETYLRRNIEQKTYAFHDQIAYNQFYRGRWNRLPLELNWKPYWGHNPNATLMHFHGPKFAAIESIIDGRWNWDTSHGRQIGSQFAQNVSDYAAAFDAVEKYLPQLLPSERDRLGSFIARLHTYDASELAPRIDLGFTKHRMFPTDLSAY
jgi:hypothetical protein